MKLYFGTHDSRRIIAYPETGEEALKEISKFLDEHHYKSYYTRFYEIEPGVIQYDVGSWSQFFWLDTNDEVSG